MYKQQRFGILLTKGVVTAFLFLPRVHISDIPGTDILLKLEWINFTDSLLNCMQCSILIDPTFYIVCQTFAVNA